MSARRRELSPESGRIHTALTRNALERRALEAQLETLIAEAIPAGLRYSDIANAAGISTGRAWRIAHAETDTEEGR